MQRARELKYLSHTAAVMGHTRHATQGTLKFNGNNHPFRGRCGNTDFALAHNGILCNDRELRKELKLPKTKIETDSYRSVANNKFWIQLITAVVEVCVMAVLEFCDKNKK